MRQKGQMLVELVMAIGLAAIILPALLTGLVTSREGKPQQEQRVQAIQLMKETEAAVKSIRDNGWSTFAINGTFHPVVSGTSWALTTGASTSGNFTRQVVISDVYRDSTGTIVAQDAPGATVDLSTKRADITVSWTQPQSSSIYSTLYLTRIQNNSSADTLKTEFDLGEYTDLAAFEDGSNNGTIRLSNNNKAKWCSPAMSNTNLELPDGPPVAVAATASAVSNTIPNDVFVATAPTTSSSIKLAHLNVPADVETPTAILRGEFTMDAAQFAGGYSPQSGTGLDNNFLTTDVVYYKSSGGSTYALLGTNLPTKEVIAILVNDGNDSTNDEYQDPVNKIYKYWTFFNTRIYNTAAGLDTGFLNPTSNAAVTSSAGDNNGFQTNATRAYSDNASYAVDTDSGNNTGTNCTGTDKDKHRFYNYNISVPSGVTINGIEVRLDSRVDSTTGSPKHCVELSWDGGTTWTTAKSTSTLTTSEVTYTLGGNGDDWGRTWSTSELSNTNFRVRVANVASNTSRDFSLDWAAVKVYYSGVASSNDQSPHDYGARSITILNNRGYVASGGYLYVFDLTNIDSKSPSAELDQVGCRIEIDGFDCKPGTPAVSKKYSDGETGTSWSTNGSPADNNCSDGGNIEIHADNDLAGVTVGGHNYIHIAVGGGANDELNIVDATSVPDLNSTPAINNNTCGTNGSSNSGWKLIGGLDFNAASGTQEAANSVFVKSDGSRAYISSNGGIDANGSGGPDSKQFYIINTSTPSNPVFLSTGASPGYEATTGFYAGGSPAPAAAIEMYPRRSMTVLNGDRAVLVGQDSSPSSGGDAEEYQVLDMETEASPTYCSGVDYDEGFNDLTYVSEKDYETYIYMITNTNDNWLKIIEGGPDDAIYVPSGSYESPIFDTASVDGSTNLRAFNRLLANINQPAGTSVQFQLAVAPAVSGSCTNSTYDYVGPGGTNDPEDTYKDVDHTGMIEYSHTIPLLSVGYYQNPGRCFRYKIFMKTADQTITPYLFDISWNFSY